MTDDIIGVDEQSMGLVMHMATQRIVLREVLLRHESRKRLEYFRDRVAYTGNPFDTVVMTWLEVDNPMAKVLADALMPNYDWDQFRRQGLVPVARGLAQKAGCLAFAKAVNDGSYEQLMKANGFTLLGMSAQVIEPYICTIICGKELEDIIDRGV